MELFSKGKPFFKGNLHCHTTNSDGKLTPEQTKAFYRERGYDFLAITDHRTRTEKTHMEDGLLVLSGMEMDYNIPGEVIHLVGVGMDEEIDHHDLSRNLQTCIDLYRQHGGRAILAHPAWSLNTVTTIAGMRGLSAAEIYNSVSTYPWNGDRADSSTEIYNSVSTYPWNGDRADSSNVLDAAAAHGTFLNFVASDDSHWYNGEAGRSFTMIQADDLTKESLFEAFDAGRFYCSQGPAFQQITVEKEIITVECSEVERVIFYSNLPWARSRCATGSGMTSASYDLTANKGETFIRIQLMDAQGRSAWSNPILL